MRIRPDDSRRQLHAGLRDRRDEIVQDRRGLRLAIEAAIDHTVSVCEGGDRTVPVPTPIMSQARLAARRHIPLEVMLRRYLAGHSILGDFVVEEAGRQAVPPEVLRWILRSQAARTDQVVAMISAAYTQEVSAVRPVTRDRRQAERVRRLLDGELVDPLGLDYELDRWHVGLQASGPSAPGAIELLTASFAVRRLVISDEDDVVLAWIGSRDRGRLREVAAHPPPNLGDGTKIGLGEPAQGVSGWRLTHDQARAAHSVAVRGSKPMVRYADVALLALAMQDDLLSTSLRMLFLEPLEQSRDGGTSMLETLRVFFELDQNVTSTAATLGVTRQTVATRLRTAEQRLGRRLTSCTSELQAALRLQEVGPIT